MTEEAGDSFNFYLKFAKPLVLGLQDPSDRITAAAWVQKLRNESIADESIRKDYLKLLLFVLHKGRLCGPFAENPSNLETLDKFPVDFKVIDVARDIIIQDEQDRKLRLMRGLGASGDYPPYSTECSADLLEYAAAQDIPKFGVHAYYAISFEPISKWDNADKAQYPRAIAEMMEKSARNVCSVPVLETPPAPAISLGQSASAPKAPPSKLAPGVKPKASKPKGPRPPSRPKTPTVPISPIDDHPIVIPRIEITEPNSSARTEQHFEARSPITWGSNLIDVNDPPERDQDIPDGDVDDFLYEEPPTEYGSVLSETTFFECNDMNSPRAAGRNFNMSAASLPYRTPHRQPPMSPTSPASLPYRTPPRLDMSAASLPYRTPPGARGSPMSPASLPYRTPPRLDNSIEIAAGSAISREIIAEANMTLQRQAAMDSDDAADPQMFEHPRGTSPSNRMQRHVTQDPLEDVFPGLNKTDDWSQNFFDEQNMDLVDDEFDDGASAAEFDSGGPPKVDYDNQIKDLLEILKERKEESPVAAGVGTTTPKLSPIPRRTKLYGTEFPIFLEDMPKYTSPTRSSPTMIAESTRRSPSRPATPGRPPSPVRDPNTDSFGLPIVRTNASPIRPPTPKAPTPKPPSPKPNTPPPSTSAPKKPSTSKTSSEAQTSVESQTSTTQDTSVKDAEAKKAEELQKRTDTQYAALYEALIVEPGDQKPPTPSNQPCANKAPPRTPGRRSPGSPQAPPPEYLMGVAGNVDYSPRGHFMDEELPEGLQSPIRGPTVLHGWQTPPHLKVQQERKTPSPYHPVIPRNANELLNLESFPEDDYIDAPETPPTPPRQFSYEEYADPFQRSPEELDVDFQGDDDDYAPGLTGILEAHEYVPYKENPVTKVQVGRRRVGVQKAQRGERGQRRADAISESPEHIMLPSPERADVRTLDTSRMGRTPSPVAVAQDQNLYNFAEEHFVNEFEVNPHQQDMLRRVIRLIDDVEGESLYKDPDMLHAEVASELPRVSPSQQDPMMFSPPREIDDLDAIEQLEASPYRAPSPEPDVEYPQFDFQGPATDFVAQPQPQPEQYQLPIQQTSPRHRFSQPATQSPQPPTDADFEQFQQMTQQCSPVTLEDSPIQLIKSPSPSPLRRRASPESPPTPHIADFIMESIQRDPEPYSDAPITLRQGIVGNKWTKLNRHSRDHVGKMVPIREVPPGYDEDLGDFNYNVDNARQTYPWAPYLRGPKMQKPNIMSPVDEGYEYVDSPVQPAGRPRITKKMIRKRINFDSVDPDPSSPEPPKVVDMPSEPISRIPDQRLPSPKPKPPPRVIYAVGSPIRLDDNLQVMEDDTVSPNTKAVQRLTRRHQELLDDQSPPMPDDLMGMNAPVQYNSPAHLMDMGISDFLPSPEMRLPSQVPGWKTPPHLAEAPTSKMSPSHPPVFANIGDELSSEMPPLDYDSLPTAQQEEFLESPLTTGAPYFMETTEVMEWPASPTSPMEDTQQPAWPSSPPSSQSPCYMQATEEPNWSESPPSAPSPPHRMPSPQQYSQPRMKKTTSKTIIKSPHMTKTTESYKTEPDDSPESYPQYSGSAGFQEYDSPVQGQYDYLFDTPDKNKDPFQSPQPMTSAMARILTRTMSPVPQERRSPSPSPRQQANMQNAPCAPSPRGASPTSPFKTPPRSVWDVREDDGLMAENLPDMPGSPYTEEEVIEVQEPDKTTKKTHITKTSPGKSKFDFLELITETEGEPSRPQPYAGLASAEEYASPKMDTSGNFIDTNVPMMERVEHLIADIPGGNTPPRSTSPFVPKAYTSPNWSPGLPIATGPAQLEEEAFPMEQFQSPKTPPSPCSMQRSPQGRSPQGQSPQGRSPSGRSPQGRSPQGRRPSPNILAMSPETFGVAPLGDENFPEMISPESSPTRFSPPRFSPDFIPPRSSPPNSCRPRQQSQRYSPEPTYPDPNEMRKEVESHQYTDQHYDRNRKLMRNYVRSGKKMVPLAKGAGRSRLGIIADIEEPADAPTASPEAFPLDAFNVSPSGRSPQPVQWVSPPADNWASGAMNTCAGANNNLSVTPPKVNDADLYESIYSSPPADLYASPDSLFSSIPMSDSLNDSSPWEAPNWSEWHSPQGSPTSPNMMQIGNPPQWETYPQNDIFEQNGAPNITAWESPQWPQWQSPNSDISDPNMIQLENPVDFPLYPQEESFEQNENYASPARSSPWGNVPESAERNYRSPDIPEMVRFMPSPVHRSPVAPDFSAYVSTPEQINYQQGRARGRGRSQATMKRRRLVFDDGPDSPPSDSMYDTARAPSPRQMSPRQASQQQHCSPQASCSGGAYNGGAQASHRSQNRTEEVIDETLTYSPSGQLQSMTKTTTKESPNDSFMEQEYRTF